jgi:hypothetical protein
MSYTSQKEKSTRTEGHTQKSGQLHEGIHNVREPRVRFVFFIGELGDFPKDEGAEVDRHGDCTYENENVDAVRRCIKCLEYDIIS